jgi:putative aldouronate transport system substrate-binding protein
MKMKKTMYCAAVLTLGLLAAACSPKSDSVPTLIWWQIGSAQAGIGEDLKVISDYTQEKIGVRVDIKQAGWGDAAQRFITMINAGQYFDILFVDGQSYNRFVALGAFEDLTELLPEQAPVLWDYIPPVLWEGVNVRDRIYSVPTYKDSAMTAYQFWDHALVTKYGLDISDTSLAGRDRNLRTIKAGEGQRFYPLLLAKSTNNFIFSNYDTLSADFSVIGVRLDDQNHRVINTLEQPDVLAAFRQLHQWFEAGLINPDANMTDDQPIYKPFFTAQAWPSVAFSYATSAGIEQYDAVKFFGPSYSTDSIQGSMNAISRNSKYKNEALKFLELVNTDTKLRDMLAYGIEGKHFEYVNGGTAVHRIRTDWPLINYQGGSYFIETPEDTVPPGYWQEVEDLNNAAVSSVMLGFMLNLEPIQNEILNCRSAWQKYFTDLNTGVSDPDVVIPQIMNELRDAGFEKVLAEAQRQVDEFFNKENL